MYTVEYIKPRDIEYIKEEWKNLEISSDMTYFQSYDWYKSILNFILEDNWQYETTVAVVRKDGDASLIAPLWILKHGTFLVNKKGCYFWGRCGWSDYLNFIYKEFVPDAYNFLLLEIHKKFGVSTFYWEQIKEKTDFYKYINSIDCIINDSITTCVSLDIPLSQESYLKNLTKNSRQNLRTAKNRLVKDGLNIQFDLDDINVDKTRCIELRNKRVIQKNKPKNILSWFKHIILDILQIHFPIEVPFVFDNNSKMMVAYSEDDIKAFFNYGISKNDNSIVLMAVGTDNSFERYSPGMLLMYKFILNLIETQSIKTLDFTRGTERYKYALGGKDHFIHNVTIKL